jgi:hypothetical protein
MKTQDAPPTPPRAHADAKSPRRATPVEQALVDRFKAALAGKEQPQQQGAGMDEEALAPLPDHESADHEPANSLETRARPQTSNDGAPDMETLPPMTVGSLASNSPAQAATAAAAASTAPAYHSAAVAQLLEKHVRQLLVSETRSARGDTPEVMLNLTDAVLPGTKITLSQTEAGWKLASSSTSTSSYRAIQELGPALKERFAARGLGDLDLQVSLEGSDN